MVSRYGVSKEGAVGVAVGVGPMHCLLPHCAGPHHHHHLSAAPHPQNPQPAHNHHVHPAHQPPPSPSPHLNHQLSHHQLTVNINHLSHQQQQQQSQHQQAPPQYRVVTANARSDFHVSGQNYGTQPGGQVGGGGGSVGVPGGRGPPQLGGLQSIGQSGAGIPPGGPAGGQAPPQAPAPGVQNQQPQGPAPTTTPPVHTPSPQEMGKQTHLQPQQPLAQVYGPTQTRPPSQGYYTPGPRQQQPRGISHRGGQGGTGAQVVGMSGVGGGGGQPATIYHTAGLPVQASAMYQVPNLHPGAHQQSVYPMNSQIPLQYPGPPQRHQTHQNQTYYTPLQHSALFTQNMFGYGTPAPAQSYYWPAGQPTNTPISLSRAGASAVSGGAQHVAGPLAGAQGAPVVPQGTLQQPTQQGQPLPPMGISLSQTDVYSGHNGGATNQANSAAKSRKPRGQNAILDIVDPTTGKNISNEIYKDNETIQSGESSNRETPQPQNNGGVAQFDSTARVTKVANEESESDSAVPTTTQSEHIVVAQSLTPSLPSIQTSSNSSNGANNSQCNTGPPTPTQNLAPSAPSALCSQPLGTTASNVAHLENVSTLQATVKEFHPRNEIKASSVTAAAAAASTPVVLEESQTTTSTAPRPLNKDDISVQLPAMTVPEVESAKSSSNLPSVTVAASASPAPTTPAPSLPPVASSTSAPTTNVTLERTSSITPAPPAAPPLAAVLPTPPPAVIAAEPPKPTITAPVVTPVPPREPIIPNPPAKTTATPSSPPRRKSQTHAHQPTPLVTESLPPPPPSSAKEPKEKKTREKSLSSRGATPTPAPLHNQTTDHHHHHQKANGDATAEKPEPEQLPTRNEVQQQKADGKAMQKQKTKNKLKPRDLNRKGAEKEGTDMDAFVNAAAQQPPTKSEAKQQQQQQQQPQQQQQQPQQSPQPPQQQQQQQQQQPQPQQPPQPPPQQQQQQQQPESKEAAAPVAKDSNKEAVRDIPKEVTDKDNLETKKEDEKEREKEKEVPLAPVKTTEKHVAPLSPEIPCESIPSETSVIEKLPSNKETAKEPSPKIEDTSKTNACNLAAKSVPNDVVDHAKVKDDIDVEAIVAQKNEENSKVSSRVSNDENPQSPPVIEKQYESKMTAQNDKEAVAPTSNQLSLKYKYKEGQWSPINKDGKRVYDRDFLMRLQDDPHSKVKPSNLPDLEVVLKDNAAKSRSMGDIKSFKDTNMNRHDALYPAFMKPPALSARTTAITRKSQQGPRPARPTKQIHVSLSLREDVKLRETANAWRPARMKPVNLTEEESKTEALYKKVRSVLNKLTPQKFNTLINQVRSLTIDTPERLQGVINLVFEKAVDEPSFSVAYALMCKELGLMEVAASDKNSEKGSSSFSFKKLIIARCQEEFERNPVDEVARAAKLKEIGECTDPAKKKDLQLALEEEDRRIRVKSVGNIRFIGELHRQGMLTTAIMRGCLSALLEQNDEDGLECLCKLLTTIGKDMESRGATEDMDKYFMKMRDLVARRGKNKISSRIRFMLQDVIDLRANKWIPRRDDNRPKTIDEIQKDAESERLDSQLNNTPMNTPRKDDRNSDRKRNRGGLSDEGGWSQAGGRSSRQTYSVETAKLKNKPPPMEEVQLGSRNAYLWKQPPSAVNSSSTLCPTNKFAYLENMTTDQDKPRMSPQLSVSRSTGPREYGRDYHKPYAGGRSSRNGSQQLTSSGSTSRDNSLLENSQSQNMSSSHSSLKSASQSSTAADEPMSEEKFAKVLDTTLKEYLKNSAVEKTAVHIQQTFPEIMMTQFIRETVNFVLEKSPIDRERISRLLSQLLSQKIVSFTRFKDGFCEVLEIVDDLVIDIPKIWAYLAEILSNSLEEEAIPLSDLKSFLDYLEEQPCGVTKFLGEVLSKLCKSKGPKWVAEKWDQSGLQLSTIFDSKPESIDRFIKDYTLEFLKGDFNSAKSSTSSQLSYQLSYPQIQQHLKRLMKENSFDEICSWIIANVGQQVKESKFIRVLTTAILETCIEKNLHSKYHVKEDTLVSLQQLIRRFVDANEVLELQCLYAVQSHITKLDHPYGIMLPIVKSLADHNIISNDAFLTWRDSDDPSERKGHVISTMSLTSFFVSLQERADDASSVEDLATGVGQDRC